MEIEGQLFFLVFAALALSMIAIPTQWATFMKIIYNQDVAPRNNFVRAMGVIFLLILWLIYKGIGA